MEINELKPRTGADVLSTYDGGLVITDNFVGGPAGKAKLMDYGIFIICTAGRAQFEYDGQTIQLCPNDLFLFMARSVMDKFMSSADFNCRTVWFTRGEMWDMNMYGKNGLTDLIALKQHPKVSLTESDYTKLDTYFQLLCQHLRNNTSGAGREIILSLFSTFILEIVSIMRRNYSSASAVKSNPGSGKLHGKLLAEKFVELVEQNEGKIRRVEDYAQMLNVTPKYLSKLLMKTMSRKPSVIIAFFTMRAIENRLRFTDMTMQQIADELNFSSASSFGKFAKEHMGMTPLEYRKKYNENPSL